MEEKNQAIKPWITPEISTLSIQSGTEQEVPEVADIS